MKRFLDFLNRKTSKITSSKAYKFISSTVILANPFSIFPQLIAVFTAPSIEGISVSMWIIFALIQGAIALEGIRVKSPAMFWSMAISLIESLTITFVVLLRS